MPPVPITRVALTAFVTMDMRTDLNAQTSTSVLKAELTTVTPMPPVSTLLAASHASVTMVIPVMALPVLTLTNVPKVQSTTVVPTLTARTSTEVTHAPVKPVTSLLQIVPIVQTSMNVARVLISVLAMPLALITKEATVVLVIQDIPEME